jgi:hypothetical protein
VARPGNRPEAEPLYATERNPQRETKGGRVAAVSRRIGTPFIPWQRDLADIAREVDPATGEPWYRQVIAIAERQTGKTVFTRAQNTDVCIYTPRARVVYTAQNRTMALQRLEEDFWVPLNDSPLRSLLNDRVGRRTGKPGLSGKGGQEHIAFGNGAGWWIDSVKDASGHGPSLDNGTIDEAFAHGDARVEQSMIPATSNRPGAQIYVVSAAGNHASTYLREKVHAARAMVEHEATKPLHLRTSRIALVEFAAGPDEDPADPATWWRRHPGLGYLTTEEFLHSAYQAAALTNLDEFTRPFLGWWPVAKAPDPVVPKLTWNEQGVALAADARPWGRPMWCVDVAPDRDWSAVGFAATLPDDAFLLDGQPARAWLDVVAHEPGTHWVVRHLVKLRTEFGGDDVVLDGTGAAGALAADLEAEGFTVHRLSLRDKVDACGAFYDDALSRRLRHRADPVLNSALMTAVKHYTGDAWTFWRGRSLADITPLYAVVLARYQLVRWLGEYAAPLSNIF